MTVRFYHLFIIFYFKVGICNLDQCVCTKLLTEPRKRYSFALTCVDFFDAGPCCHSMRF